MNRFLPLLLVLFPVLLFAQDKAPKWDVNAPGDSFGYQAHEFTVSEGTWMNLDVSPDGRTIAFDLLGDIYTLPIGGGTATPLRTGIAWEIQPRFSPDGKYIAFTSDAGGGDNVWLMNADASEPKQVTKEEFRLLNNADWTPDGNYLVARKHFTSGRSLGAGEIWLYHKTGGSGMQLTERKNDQQDVNEPCVSPDGRYVYYSEDMYPGGNFQYNKDPNSQIYVIKRYDRETGKTKTVTGGPGGAVRPQISPDGKRLAFVRRVRTQSVLYVRDLASGAEFPIYDQLSKDQQEAWAIHGVYTGFDWLPGGEELVIWAKGKLWRINATSGKAVEIPFTVTVNTQLAETVEFKNNAFDARVRAKAIRHAVTSPDGKTLVFNAAGKLYKKALPNGTPERLTTSEALEFEPTFSPDGQDVVYVDWTDTDLGHVMRVPLRGGTPRALTTEKGIYRTPAFRPDGQEIVFRKDGGNSHQGYVHCQEPGLYRMPAAGGDMTLVTPNGEYPMYTTDGKRILYQRGGFLFGSLTKSLHSIDPNGYDDRKIADAKHAQRFVVSPDNQWIAWSELYKVYVAPMPATGQTVGLSKDTKAVPVVQVTKDAGINLHWSKDSEQLHWTLGDTYYSDRLDERFAFLEGARDSLPPLDTTGITIDLMLQADRPEGTIAFTNARLITMRGDEVIENGTLIVEGNEIKALGRDLKIPRSAKVINLKGKTVMPGIVDVHGHLGNFRYGLSPEKQWEYHVNLAYGVTTAHDPSSNSEMIFSQSEMLKTGRMIGPRLFSTGTILYGAEGDFKAVINNLDDARSAIRRTQAYGAFSVKSYNQPRREQRQQVLQAARELGVLVVPEGGSFFNHNLSMVADGHTGVEHNIPVAPLYDDVQQFWKRSGTANTPTLIVNYGGINGEYYFYQHDEVWDRDRLLNFMPRTALDSRSRHRTIIPEEEYENGHILTSQSCKALADQGVKINLGAHGQLQGLGAHWELWMLAQGGMTPHEALRAATMNGAEYLGMDHQIGSLQAGKLADLIVLDANPLENIRNSEQVRYTMLNGRLYESSTLNEVGNYSVERSPFWFEVAGGGQVPAGAVHSFTSGGCGCGG